MKKQIKRNSLGEDNLLVSWELEVSKEECVF